MILDPTPFGDFLPDLSAYDLQGSINIKNCVPSLDGYRQMPGPSVFSAALNARCQGAFTEIQSDGSVHAYAADATKLYRLVGATWTDASKTGGYTVADDVFVEFAKFNENIITTQINDPVQFVVMGQSTFADLITSDCKPQARHIGVTDNFVILGNTSESGTVYPYRLRWSAFDDPADFDPSATTQADYQDLPEHGWIQKIIGFGRDAYVFQERAIRVMRYEGTPRIFRLDVTEENRGAIAPGAVVANGRFVFYIADDGFYMWDGLQSRAIGKEKVDAWFYDNVDSQYLHRTSAAIDPSRALVVWAWVTTGSIPDRFLVYSWATEKWTFGEVTNEFIFRDLSKGYTLDELDEVSATLEGLPFSLDSRVWAPGNILLSGFDSSHQLTHYTGAALTAELDTGERQIYAGHVGKVESVRPLIEGSNATISVQMGTRATLQDAVSYGSSTSLNGIGEADVRSAGRYQRARVTVSGGFDRAIGAIYDGMPWGRQ